MNEYPADYSVQPDRKEHGKEIDRQFPHRIPCGLPMLAQEISRSKAVGLRLESATDSDVKHLADLTGLQHLNPRLTQITDAGLAHLEGSAELRGLDLSGTQITDAGLEHLKGLEPTETWLGGTQVTDPGIQRLEQRLPELIISRDRVK